MGEGQEPRFLFVVSDGQQPLPENATLMQPDMMANQAFMA